MPPEETRAQAPGAGSERVAIFIDGRNFLHSLRLLREETVPLTGPTLEEELRYLSDMQHGHFNLLSFSNELIGERLCVFKGFYIGALTKAFFRKQPNKRLKLTFSAKKQTQIKLFQRIADFGFEIIKKPLEITESSLKEKEIDMKMGLDMFIKASLNEYDSAILISSDRDFAPVIKSIHQYTKKKVEYVALGEHICPTLMTSADTLHFFDQNILMRHKESVVST